MNCEVVVNGTEATLIKSIDIDDAYTICKKIKSSKNPVTDTLTPFMEQRGIAWKNAHLAASIIESL